MGGAVAETLPHALYRLLECGVKTALLVAGEDRMLS